MIGLPTFTRSRSAAALGVEDRLFQAIAVLRWVLLINQLGLTWIRRDNFTQPVAGWSIVLLLVVWSAAVTWAYADPARRTAPWLIGDLGIAIFALATSPWVKGDGFNATVPGFWVMAPLLAWAVHWRWPGGVIAGTLVVVADLTSRRGIDQGNYGHAFLLALGGLVVGYMVTSLQRAAEERDAAERAAAAAAERGRLARAVHDGVLQVLALTQRRGGEPGGDAELGRLAGDQERALRALIRQQDADPLAVRLPEGAAPGVSESGARESGPGSSGMAGSGPHRPADVAAMVQTLGQDRQLRLHIATPSGPVTLPAPLARELVDATAAALHNVERHVGEGAEAWVLVEDLGDQVVVSVRDEGPGIPEGRLDQARADGRLGVSGSIIDRMASIGGQADLITGSGVGGTEWELSVRRP